MVRRRPLVVALWLSIVLAGCGGEQSTASPDDSILEPRALTDEDRRLLDASIGPGTADRIAAVAIDGDVCIALGGAVRSSMALDAAAGEELVALVSSEQPAMGRAAEALRSAGFTTTADHWARYEAALAETAADIDLADAASRERANQRFRTVQAMGAGSTELELGALATVCGVG